MTDYAKLVERLRNEPFQEDGDEAADAIETLEREKAELLEVLGETQPFIRHSESVAKELGSWSHYHAKETLNKVERITKRSQS